METPGKVLEGGLQELISELSLKGLPEVKHSFIQQIFTEHWSTR